MKRIFYLFSSISALAVLHAHTPTPTVVVDVPEPHFRAPVWTIDNASLDPYVENAAPLSNPMAVVSDGVSLTIAGFYNHLIKIYDETDGGKPLDHIWFRGYSRELHGLSIAVSEPVAQAAAADESDSASNDYSVMGYLATHCPSENRSTLIHSGSLYKLTRRRVVFPLPEDYSKHSDRFKLPEQSRALPICRIPMLSGNFATVNMPKLLSSKDGARFYFLDRHLSALYVVYSNITTRDMSSSADPLGPECAVFRVSLEAVPIIDMALDRERDIVFVSRVDQNIMAIDGKTGLVLTVFSVNNRRPFGIQWDESIQSLIVSYRFENSMHRAPYFSSDDQRDTAGPFTDMIARVNLSGPVSTWQLASSKLGWIVFPPLAYIKDIQPLQESGKFGVLLMQKEEFRGYLPFETYFSYSTEIGIYWLTMQWTNTAPTAIQEESKKAEIAEAEQVVYSLAPAYRQLSNLTLSLKADYKPAIQNPVSANYNNNEPKDPRQQLYVYGVTNSSRTTLVRLDRIVEQSTQEGGAQATAQASPVAAGEEASQQASTAESNPVPPPSSEPAADTLLSQEK